ncbi:hypothetical protein LINGRAHAP2_LOCUS4063 [Linum grandiflorum]
MYISPSVRPLLSTWFDPEPDGNCGFRAIAHYYFGDQERYMEIRGYLVHEIEAHWDVGPGVSRPTSIVSLVNNGTHWVLVQLCDVDGVYALPEFHGMWTGIHNHHAGKVESWEAMYEDERQLHINRGGDD